MVAPIMEAFSVDGPPDPTTVSCEPVDRAVDRLIQDSDLHFGMIAADSSRYQVNDLDALYDVQRDHPEVHIRVAKQPTTSYSEGCGKRSIDHHDRATIVRCSDDTARRCGEKCIRTVLGDEVHDSLSPIPIQEGSPKDVGATF